MDIVGANIRKIRLSKGLLQKELAYLAQMNPSNLSKLERGDYTWTKTNLERIAMALNVGLVTLFTEEPKASLRGLPAGAAKSSAPNDNSQALAAVEAKLERILFVLGDRSRIA
jgi:transcriptional regulator with XRE-family HTH domain